MNAQRRAMTLVEVVLSAGLATVLVAGLISALVLASHAVPRQTKDSESLARNNAALEQLSADLFSALSIVEHAADTLEFTVADRDGDANPEVIRYTWSGVAGAPLLRGYNGKAAAAVATDVQSFALDYELQTVTTTKEVTATTDSGEVALASFSGWTGLSGTTTTGYLLATASFPVEYFKFTTAFPAGMTSWSITKVTLQVRDSSTTAETMTLSLHPPATAGQPQPNLATTYGTPATASDAGLTTAFKPVDFLFSNVSFTQPLTEMVIVVKGSAGAGLRSMYYTNTSGPTSDTQTMLWSTNSGSSWLPSSNTNRNDMAYAVYGHIYGTSKQTTEASRYFVTGVTATLTSGASGAASVTTIVQTVNTPEVETP